MFKRLLTVAIVAASLAFAAKVSADGAATYALVTYKAGHRYVDDTGLTAEDCKAELATAFADDLDGIACERQ